MINSFCIPDIAAIPEGGCIMPAEWNIAYCRLSMRLYVCVCVSVFVTSSIFFGYKPQTSNTLCVSWSPGLHPLPSSKFSEGPSHQHASKLKTWPQRWQEYPSLLGRHHCLLACTVLPGSCSGADGITTRLITVCYIDVKPCHACLKQVWLEH